MADFREMSDVTNWVAGHSEALLHAMIANGGFNLRNTKVAQEWVRQKNEFLARQDQAARDAHQRALEEGQRQLNMRAVVAAELAAEAAAAQAISANKAAAEAKAARIISMIAVAISLVTGAPQILAFIHQFL
jgi:hypothetical protein